MIFPDNVIENLLKKNPSDAGMAIAMVMYNAGLPSTLGSNIIADVDHKYNKSISWEDMVVIASDVLFNT